MKYYALMILITSSCLMLRLDRAEGAIVIYDDRTEWETAVGGSPDFVETFDSFAGPDNTSYNESPVQTGYFEIEAFSDSWTNEITNSWTWEGIEPPSIYGFGDFWGNGVVLSFDQELSGWGANVRTSGGTEIVLLSEETELAVFEPWKGYAANSFFFGISLTEGETIDAIELRRNNAGSGFYLDDVAGKFSPSSVTTVPEPSMMALFTLGAAGIGLASRRRFTQRTDK